MSLSCLQCRSLFLLLWYFCFVLMFDMLVCLLLQYELLQTDSVKALKP